jgi:predicted metal-dependent peptidase
MTQQQSVKRHPALTEAISALLVRHPFFASLLLDLTDIVEATQLPDTSQLNTCATNGKTIWVNPENFAKYTIDERIGMLVHEIDHIIFQHMSRAQAYQQLGVGPDLETFSHKKFNHACDYIINAHLTSQGFKLPLGSLQNSQVTADDIADEVYLKLPKDEENKPDGPDQHVPDDQQVATDKPTMQAALKKAQEMAKMQGKGAGGMERFIDDFCTPKISWQEHLRKALMANTRGRDVYTWQRPNRRKLAIAPHVYMPGRAGLQGPEIAVEIDTSGSIGEKELKTFLGELSGIMDEIQPRKIHVAYVDDALHGDIIELEDSNELTELGKKAGGGGGTDMTVIFREIEDRQLPIESVVVFSDGYTPFGEDVGIPTVWALTTPGIVAPWGTTVHVPLGDQEES